ncbi:DUF3267 domain-containing protein [Serpentinicella sp. ANB-PHB4]|uniref:DUF3267 domain-containing protein n=1 Tax=Serpentinicella sp. ANB-PHB4 TaxID=3074076 RepID=UPI002858F747|nr:DUF3267 domain-containing protein [Serpentinicella sp. ANB-PHB4]MDR5659252.1 DUF3267 domain-containing protein [Serpentinicella sp. ANB-PHB4]
MKLKWKGRYKDPSQLEKGNLPEHAIKFNEPDSLGKFSLVSGVFVIPIFIIGALTTVIKTGIEGASPNVGLNFYAFIASYFAIGVHELLHAIVFPKDAEVELWYAPKNLAAFVHSTYPVSKRRFILLCLLPSLVLGFLPLAVWVFIPSYLSIANFIYSFAIFELLGCTGDFLNVYNTYTQMPKDAMTQASGFHSYWYVEWEEVAEG